MTEITREQHLEWCKQRAREYLDTGDARNAWASMVSDMSKHPETANHSALALGTILLFGGQMNTVEGTRRFIEGFN